jgi:hypothetical protein
LNGVLHRGGKFAVGSAELLKEHVSKAGIRLIHPDGVHQLFDVVVHRNTYEESRGSEILNATAHAVLSS